MAALWNKHYIKTHHELEHRLARFRLAWQFCFIITVYTPLICGMSKQTRALMTSTCVYNYEQMVIELTKTVYYLLR